LSFYLDTSFVVSAFSKETRSQDALDWLSDHQSMQLHTSGWVATEFASAIGLKIRTGQFDPRDLPELKAQWIEFRSTKLSSIAIEDTDYELAAHMIYHSATGLRSGDALHLAICQRMEAKIVTFDKGLKHAADEFGIAAIIP
jgi:uncharacterized protein